MRYRIDGELISEGRLLELINVLTKAQPFGIEDGLRMMSRLFPEIAITESPDWSRQKFPAETINP